MSTALFLAIIALPISAVAFAVLYANHDSFWAMCWLDLLPVLWVAVAVLAIRDGLKRHSWRQLIGVAALLVPMALLDATANSNRFWLHQLFTFRPLELFPSPNPRGWFQEFTVCAQRASCTPHGTVTQTQTFRLDKVPARCCSVRVVNGMSGKHMVEQFRIVLNGKEVKLRTGAELQIAEVELRTENTISVQLSGAPDAYIYIVISYTGKSTHQLPSQQAAAVEISP